MRRTRPGLALLGALLLGLAPACSQDDGATVRTEEPGGSATGHGSMSGSATGSGSASRATACKPVGDANTADTRVVVKLREWSVVPARPSAPAGRINLHPENDGAEAHELVVIRADHPAALPTAEDGSVDETKLAPGALVGEVEPFSPGETCDGTWELTPGTYALLCNLVEQHDGVPMVHYQLGMHAGFTVT